MINKKFDNIPKTNYDPNNMPNNNANNINNTNDANYNVNNWNLPHQSKSNNNLNYNIIPIQIKNISNQNSIPYQTNNNPNQTNINNHNIHNNIPINPKRRSESYNSTNINANGKTTNPFEELEKSRKLKEMELERMINSRSQANKIYNEELSSFYNTSRSNNQNNSNNPNNSFHSNRNISNLSNLSGRYMNTLQNEDNYNTSNHNSHNTINHNNTNNIDYTDQYLQTSNLSNISHMNLNNNYNNYTNTYNNQNTNNINNKNNDDSTLLLSNLENTNKSNNAKKFKLEEIYNVTEELNESRSVMFSKHIEKERLDSLGRLESLGNNRDRDYRDNIDNRDNMDNKDDKDNSIVSIPEDLNNISHLSHQSVKSLNNVNSNSNIIKNSKSKETNNNINKKTQSRSSFEYFSGHFIDPRQIINSLIQIISNHFTDDLTIQKRIFFDNYKKQNQIILTIKLEENKTLKLNINLDKFLLRSIFKQFKKALFNNKSKRIEYRQQISIALQFREYLQYERKNKIFGELKVYAKTQIEKYNRLRIKRNYSLIWDALDNWKLYVNYRKIKTYFVDKFKQKIFDGFKLIYQESKKTKKTINILNYIFKMKYTFQKLRRNQIINSNSKINKQISNEIVRKNLIKKIFGVLKLNYMKRKTKNIVPAEKENEYINLEIVSKTSSKNEQNSNGKVVTTKITNRNVKIK